MAEEHVRELKLWEEIGGWHAKRHETMIEEAQAHARFWDAARSVRWPGALLEQQRDAARVARELIGEKAYWLGQWPNPIPLHHIPWD